MADIFIISKLIIKKNLTDLSDQEKAELEAFTKTYPFLRNINFESLVDKISEYDNVDKEKAWENIVSKSQTKRRKTVASIFRKPILKYAAAAIIVSILSIGYLFKDKVSRKNIEVEHNVVEEVIHPGTNKATLILGDGSQISLEKDSDFQTKNLKSNGEEIVYKEDQNVKELVYNYLSVPRGGQFYIKLSDGTRVWLNSETQLKYPANFIQGKTREVELVYGEAYFEVSPSTEHNGAKFKVINNAQDVVVLGTEFNIKAYKDESNIYTTLVKGKVEINTSKVKQALIPNQQSNVDVANNSISVSVVDVDSEISWRRGIFSFKGRSLKYIMKVLSRWYDVDVIFVNKDLESIKFKGTLSKNQNLEEILSIMKSNTINKYEIKGKTIIIK